MKWWYNKEENKIYFTKKLPKMKNGIRVYFYRGSRGSDDRADYPIATSDTQKENSISWFDDDDNVKILDILIKKKRGFGLLGYYWIKLDQLIGTVH